MNTETKSCLLIGYRRFRNLKDIIHILLMNDIKNIYISLDIPKDISHEYKSSYDDFIIYLKDIKSKYGDCVILRKAKKNIGCAVNILSSIEWFFQSENSGYIFEDDCIPTEKFFTFVNKNVSYLKKHENVLLISGNQFVPFNLTNGNGFVSKYALTWGWFTFDFKWNIIKKLIFDSAKGFGPSIISFRERIFWSSGHRRAKNRFTDVWDTSLINGMLKNSFNSLLPGINLVNNVGDDRFAVHTKKRSEFINMKESNHKLSDIIQSKNVLADKWLEKKFYKIKYRHILTTRITWLKDKIKMLGENNSTLESDYINSSMLYAYISLSTSE